MRSLNLTLVPEPLSQGWRGLGGGHAVSSAKGVRRGSRNMAPRYGGKSEASTGEGIGFGNRVMTRVA